MFTCKTRSYKSSGFDSQAARRGGGGSGPKPGGEETVARRKRKGRVRKGGRGERSRRQRKEGDAGCVRVVPCGIRRSQVRHAFLFRS